MKIEHVAIWVKNIDRVCEFYRKYFGGVVQPLYHNPAKQFTSRFIIFEDGARLEIMHRPDPNISLGSSAPMQPYTSRSSGKKIRSVSHLMKSNMFHVEHIGYAHICFSVGSKEKVNRLTQKMANECVIIIKQPRVTGDGYYESVVLDPEGNRIEITE